jgi:hypothetical protein
MANLSNYKCILHEQTASIDSNGSVTYNEVYMVITPKTSTVMDIIKSAGNNGSSLSALPTYKSKREEVPVSSINIERWHEANVKEIGGIEHATIWKYSVTYNKTSGNKLAGLGAEAPWENAYASNCSLSPKYYTERSCTTLKTVNQSGVLLDSSDQTKRIIQNALGEPVYRDKEVFNAVLSFDYALKRFDVNKVIKYTGSVNSSAITVAGLTIPSGKGRIVSLVPSVQVFNDKEYTSVHVEIEIALYKSVYKDTLLGNSRWAIPTSMSTGEGYKSTTSVPEDQIRAYPIQMLECDLKDVGSYSGILWFSRARKLGYFGHAKDGHRSINRSLYSYVTEEYPLKKDGTMYLGTRTSAGTVQLDLDDPNLDKIVVTDNYVFSWDALGFPKKGFKDE